MRRIIMRRMLLVSWCGLVDNVVGMRMGELNERLVCVRW